MDQDATWYGAGAFLVFLDGGGTAGNREVWGSRVIPLPQGMGFGEALCSLARKFLVIFNENDALCAS